MDLAKLLEVIQVQRHDFLNHLQVISGLTQLNKVDRVREYITRVSAEMGRMSKTAGVKLPEVTAALLAGFNDASMAQVELELTVDSDLLCCAVPAAVAGGALEMSLNLIIEAMAHKVGGPSGEEKRTLRVTIEESEKQCTCRLLFPEPPHLDLNQVADRLAEVGDLLNPYGGRVNLFVAGEGMEIILVFPRK